MITLPGNTSYQSFPSPFPQEVLMSQPISQSPFRLDSASGLSARINRNGSLYRLDYKDIILNLFPGNELEGGPANIYLRRLGATTDFIPLLGPESPSTFSANAQGFSASGVWRDIRYGVTLQLAESAPAWFWHVTLENAGTETIQVDLIHVQDLAVAAYGAIRQNEYYVSQYLDHAPLVHPQQGVVIATRQNQSVGGRNPWCVIGSLGNGVSYATDALQVVGLSRRANHSPEGIANGLPGQRQQHEHAMAAIQDAALTLAPGQTIQNGFFGWLEEHHPAATSMIDLGFVDRALALPERLARASADVGTENPPSPSGFTDCPVLTAAALDGAEIERLFGSDRHHEEHEGDTLLSFFAGRRCHVVLKAKELAVLRPHGHILRTGGALTPDESALTSTAWMGGVFHSMVTQGHVSINRFLSTTHSYLGLFRSHGQRIFIETTEGWQRLDLPSVFEMSPESCRWIYRHAGGLLEVRSGAATDRHELTLDIVVVEGAPLRCLISHHVALNGDDGAEARPVIYERQGLAVFVRAEADSDVGRRFPEGGFRIEPQPGTALEQIGGDELLFRDGLSRQQPFLCLITESARAVGLRITGHLVPAGAARSITADAYWDECTAGLSLSRAAPESVRRMSDILPWYAHNALIHFLAPRGLEQYSGGGWGTRDVTQGPVEFLMAVGQFAPIRDLLLRVFRQQNPDGDWPQWFMFFERERNIRPGDSHGDIVFWPLLALAQYLNATGDAAILKERVPFFQGNPDAEEPVSLWQHVETALELIHQRVIPGTQLATYGHGDWNDSLQPADPKLRERLCSAWTVTLHYQVLTTLAEALGGIGRVEEAGMLETMAESVLADFHQYLLVDGVVTTGYAYFEESGNVDYLLHPRDQKTGLSYSLLPMVHAVINHMLSPEAAGHQLAVIRQHLHGPDGAHLFDRPMVYRGGPMTIFQRAESSSFFGREIGNMYTHAHLRYAEALWHFGDAEGFFAALSKAVPIDLQSSIAPASRRQANCYYSSSDAAFRDRYQAYDEYDRALNGEIQLEGGWRVYSSGAGIATSLILRCLFGIRPSSSSVVIDPVLPRSLDGLQINLNIAGARFELTYEVGEKGSGPVALELNGAPLSFTRLDNPYREGGVEVALVALRQAMAPDTHRLGIRLG
jgi:cellobiose phosphorylase